MDSFPLYLLRLNGEWQVVFPEDRADLDHSDFWEKTVAQVVASHYQIPAKKLANFPYCLRRARVVGDKVFYGEEHDRKLLQVIRKAVGNKKLVFAYDDHEKRLPFEVLAFRRLVRHYHRK